VKPKHTNVFNFATRKQLILRMNST